ncbi:MAG TPA: hypothetical protein VNG51_17995 [Ktedonobacteraceae bacterium]|nr:hypothetical protein [Ktedonobacteraceae bacterium]
MHDDKICSKYNEPVIPDEQGNCSLCRASLVNVISTYTHQQAIEDGVLVEVFKNRWSELTGGRPILATSHLFNEVSLAGLLEIWNAFVAWQEESPHTIAEDENEDNQTFTTTMNDKKIWLIDDGQVFTMMYPADY